MLLKKRTHKTQHQSNKNSASKCMRALQDSALSAGVVVVKDTLMLAPLHIRACTHTPTATCHHTLSLQYSQVPLWIRNATEGILIAAITQRN